MMLGAALSVPFLATNAPADASVAVVEGWIDAGHMPQVAQLLRSNRYRTIYVTGTPRNFSYTLRHGDTVMVELPQERTGTLTLNTCGARDVSVNVFAGDSLVLASPVSADCHDRNVLLDRPFRLLRFTPAHPGTPDPTWELLFTLYARLDGVELHALQRSVKLIRASGVIENGTPSFADACADALVHTGMDGTSIIRLPTVMAHEGRTWANARRFARETRAKGIGRADVISFGIHARRSQAVYQKACGDAVVIGIRCIDDPELTGARWWISWRAWLKLFKEIACMIATTFMDAPGLPWAM